MQIKPRMRWKGLIWGIILSIPFWFGIVSLVRGATYYVDCNANGDAGTGLTTALDVAWKTISKVNGSAFSPGDSVLLNRTCTWYEQLTMPSSGVSEELTPFVDITASTWTNYIGTSSDTGTIDASDQDYGAKSDGSTTYAAQWSNFGRVSSGVTWNTGWIFQGLVIPIGATITSATIAMIPNANRTEATVNVRIWGEAADNPAGFVDLTDFQTRVANVTTAYANWDAIASWTGGQTYTSPNFSNVVQEIVNRAGWNSGQSIGIFIKDNGSSNGAYRNVYTRDATHTTNLSVLTVTYTSPVATTWQTSRAIAPYQVYFDDVAGTEVGSAALCNGARKWNWSGGVLTLYSAAAPAVTYTKIEASNLFNNYINFGSYGSGEAPVINASYAPSWATDEANIYHIHSVTEPFRVNFGTTLGIRLYAKASLSAANQWFWDSATSILYIYSATDPTSTVTIYLSKSLVGNSKNYLKLDNLHVMNGADISGTNCVLSNNVFEDFMTPRNWHFDVSGVYNYNYAVITLTNGSTSVLYRVRNITSHTWLTDYTRTFALQYAYTGTTANIALISDLHSGAADTRLTNAISDLEGISPALSVNTIFVLGDLVGTPADNEYDNYLAQRAAATNITSWYQLSGNHDSITSFLTKLGYTYHYNTVTIGNVVFILMGNDVAGMNGSLSADARTFLNDTMSANQTKNIFIMSHQGRYNTTRQTSRTGGCLGYNIAGADLVEAIIGKYKWDAWFCGHSHGWTGTPVYNSTWISSFPRTKLAIGGVSSAMQNCTFYNVDLQANETCTVTNTIGHTELGNNIEIYESKTVTGTYNMFDQSVPAGPTVNSDTNLTVGTYTDGSSTTKWSTDPLFISSSDCRLQGTSPAKNAGSDLGSIYATDNAGNDQRRFGRGWEMGAYVFKQSPSFGIGF